VIAGMRVAHPPDWENLMQGAGASGMLLLGFKNPALKPLIGKTLAEVAEARHVSAEDAAIDLVIENGADPFVAYSLISEDNIRHQIAIPWVSFGSDAEASAPEGAFLLSSTHPRAYGNFARLLARYVRDEHALTLAAAIRKLAALPADVLSLTGRGHLRAGAFADVVIFDPDKIQDHATYQKPLQYATGVRDVFVNGQWALKDGVPTGAPSGRALRGRAWTGAGGGCRASSADWHWIDQPPAAVRR
jgi:N-acyl-D-amino-acid deacylase